MSQSHETPRSNLSQSQASISIDDIVGSAINSNKQAFKVITDRRGYESISETFLSRKLYNIQSLIDAIDGNYDFNQHLQIFRHACHDIGLERGPLGPICLSETGSRFLSFHQSMNILVERIRQLANTPEFRRKIHDRRYASKMTEASLEQYVRSVLDRYSRTVVVRLDLHYLKIADLRLRIEDLYQDLDTIIRARERSQIFEHESGYAWSIEQGEDGGFHIHAAFFFNGEHVRKDWYKAQEIGELWKKITRGRGYFHNCNQNKARHERLGVGTVKRADQAACDDVVFALSYLAKDDQHLCIKPRGARTFGKGRML